MMYILEKHKGFSLLELMIVIAIVGILIAVAVPSYKSYVNRTKFSGVTSALRDAEAAVNIHLVETGVSDTTGSCANMDYSVSNDLVASATVDSNCKVTITSQAYPFSGSAQVITGIPALSETGIVWACQTDSVYVVGDDCTLPPSPEQQVIIDILDFLDSSKTQVEDYYHANGSFPGEFYLPGHANLTWNSRWRADHFIELNVNLGNSGWGQILVIPTIDSNGNFTWDCSNSPNYSMNCAYLPSACDCNPH